MRVYEIAAGSTSIEGLRRAERPDPAPGPGEVLVGVRACSLNFRDLGVVSGRYFGGALGRDTVPLSDGAGAVLAVGDGVETFRVGDRVAGTFFRDWIAGPLTRRLFPFQLGAGLDGMLAEQVVLPERALVHVPDHLSFAEAATLPCAALTAWNALFVSGRLQPGETVLLLGTGGVSIFALQFAKLAGARVIVTSSSDEKLERARTLGADDLVNYRSTPDWDREVLRLTDGEGVDHIVEVGGAGTLPRSLETVKTAGHVAVIGVVAGGGEVNPLPLIPKAIRVQGIYVGSRTMFETMNAAIAMHGLKPVIDERFGFEEARAAYEHLPSGSHFGKLVIELGQP